MPAFVVIPCISFFFHYIENIALHFHVSGSQFVGQSFTHIFVEAGCILTNSAD